MDTPPIIWLAVCVCVCVPMCVVYKLAVTTYTAMFTLNMVYIIKFHSTLVIALIMQQKIIH